MFSQLWSAVLLLSSLSLWNVLHVQAIPVNVTTPDSRRYQGLRRTLTTTSRNTNHVDRRASTDTIPAARRGFDIPITRRDPKTTRNAKRDDVDGSVGLGDQSDLLYTVPIEYEKAGVTIALNLDTGSSDHWVITDQCQTTQCAATTSARYPASGVNTTNTFVTMAYGDSKTGTSASGPVAYETITIAGVSMTDQAYAAINVTDNVAINYGASGIFGLGFPSGSQIQQALVATQFGQSRQTNDFIKSTDAYGPLLSRIVETGELENPMFAITLQRSQVDVSGSGVLSVGKLPDGVDNSSLTWVPVRLYSAADGGMPAPSFAPNEVYPFRWEVEIDEVQLDGKPLPASSMQGVSTGKMSALIDTGNSILRGPADTVDAILSTVSPTYAQNNRNSPLLPCAAAHNLTYIIGGKPFPVSPLDFLGPTSNGGTRTCVANSIVSTDPPSVGALFAWSLGDPFLKSTLVAFHFGNLTHPSVDPPRIGFMTLVPENADEQLTQAVADAATNGGKFESTTVIAPTQAAAAAPDVTVSAGGKPTPTINAADVQKTTGGSAGSSSDNAPGAAGSGSGTADAATQSGTGDGKSNSASALRSTSVLSLVVVGVLGLWMS